jgi:type I restriction enzyme S subunit
MNAERLQAHYERIADAPDAMGRLRCFVLDLAVRGKLVQQNPDGGEPRPHQRARSGDFH